MSSHRIGGNEHGRGRIFTVGDALTRGGERDRDLVTVNLDGQARRVTHTFKRTLPLETPSLIGAAPSALYPL